MPAKPPTSKRAESPSKPGDERVTQFSIFLPNTVGAFLHVVKMLNEHHVHVLATSIEASADSAIVRVVVSDPESVEGVFHLHSIPYSTCPLLVVELREATQLGDMLAALLAAESKYFGSYALLTRPHGHAALALHVEDNDLRAARAARERLSDPRPGRHLPVTGDCREAQAVRGSVRLLASETFGIF